MTDAATTIGCDMNFIISFLGYEKNCETQLEFF